ncbi:MAG: MBL fold metallo-hydrolase [Eubacteriales bacterium]|nr:MBL fold metallo-hydrolase [Eubacteriales bacterium]
MIKISTFILGDMQTNCYFLIDERSSETAVVDPAASADKIIRKINERNLKVKYIILTHAHFDHMMALEELRDMLRVPVYVHEQDAPALLNPEQSYMNSFGNSKVPGKPADLLLNDGDTLSLGQSSIKILHTPGHTKGSICLITEDNIISGDTLFRGDIGRYDLYGGDFNQLKQSLQKIAALDGDYKIYPGHGSSTGLNTERKNNIYLIK